MHKHGLNIINLKKINDNDVYCGIDQNPEHIQDHEWGPKWDPVGITRNKYTMDKLLQKNINKIPLLGHKDLYNHYYTIEKSLLDAWDKPPSKHSNKIYKSLSSEEIEKNWISFMKGYNLDTIIEEITDEDNNDVIIEVEI
jgi:hypothetical protein